MLSELDEVVQEILRKYKSALSYIGVDFGQEDVQEALLNAYDNLEAIFQRVIEYWYFQQRKNQTITDPNAVLIKALSEGWTPVNWQDKYLNNPNFRSQGLLWWEKAAQVWGEDVRNELIADVGETDEGYDYIRFRSGKTLSLRIAEIWGWQRVLDWAREKNS